ncbi:extracellular solute-binding protein [Streptomyces sp. NPDC051561]|uniref:extracellular solute-binding protein n=1 Tax=Streptomyces sp. NPDC051561 TaxID=3365658 RepID=UPI0037AABAAA
MNLVQRRSIAVSTALAACGALLTGCGLLPGSSSADETKTVTIWLMKDSASREFIKRFTEEFEKDNKNIKLDIQIQAWAGIGPKVNKALDSTDPPDVIEVGNTHVAQYAERGGLENLTLEAVRDFGSDDWLPGLAAPGSIDKAQYGIPWYAANRVVVYRKDLFEKAGIKQPPRDRTEWLNATKRVNAGGNQGIYLAGQDWYTLAGFIWDEGGELATETNGKWSGTLDTPRALAGMAFYQELQELGDGPKDADEEKPPQAGQFAQGDIAQIIATPGTAKLIEEKNPEMRGKLGFFPLPGKKRGAPGSVFIGGSDLVVPQNSDQRRSAIKVIEALSGEKWQVELARAMNYVPNKVSLSSAVGNGDEGMVAMTQGSFAGRATPASPKWGQVEADNPIKAYMTEVLNGANPRTAAKKASDSISATLQRIGNGEE